MKLSIHSRIALAGGIVVLCVAALVTSINDSNNGTSTVSSAVQTSEYCSNLLANETPSVYCGTAIHDEAADPYSDANLFAKEG